MNESECDKKGDFTKDCNLTIASFPVSPRRVCVVGDDRRLCPHWNNGKAVIDSLTARLVFLYKWCLSLFSNQSRGFFPLFILIMSERVRKQFQDITLGIEDDVVDLPLDLVAEAEEETRFALIGKPLNPRKQNIRAMLSALPRLWGVADEVVGRVLENNRVQFVFRSEESLLSVLRRGPWSFNEWMVSLQRWFPNHTDEDLNHMTFWTQVRGIPSQYLTQRMVVRIGHELGEYIDTDFQSEGTHNVDYVRIRLLKNVNAPLRFQRIFRFGDQTAVLKIRYEKLRGFCSVCGMMIHDSNDCPHNNPNGEDAPYDDDNADDHEDDGPPPGFSAPEHQVLPDSDDPGNSTHDNQRDPPVQESTPTKKRKAEDSVPTVEVYPLCYETRQGLLYEEVTEQVLKKMRRQAETREGRQWFQAVHDHEASSSHAAPGTQKTNNREGTVDHKPPASG